MRSGGSLRLAAFVLLLVHLAALFADFLAPNGYATQERTLPYAPPTAVRFVDTEGRFHLRPFIYRWIPRGEGYVEDRSQRHPLRWLGEGEPHHLLGLFPTRRRLVTVDEPARLFLLGTDGYGRDQYSRLLHGGRISLFAGLIAATLALLAGALIGSVSGFYGGRTDALLMRLTEVFMALPWLFLLMAVRAFLPIDLPPSRAFLMIIAIIGLLGWTRPARLVRGVALSTREREFVHAARGFGASDSYLLTRHILPATLSIVLTQGALRVPLYILAEVTLSFLGLGIQEPVPSWGNMLAELQRYHVLSSSWWWMAAPALALVVVVFAYHVLAQELENRHG